MKAIFWKSHIDTFTRKDGAVVGAHDDKRVKTEPTVNVSMTGLTHKQWKKSAPHKGKVNGWDHFHDQIRDKHVLMTPYNSVHFDSEDEAKEWGAKNKGNQKGPFAEKPVENEKTTREARAHKLNGGKDWRDEENWHTRTQMKMRHHSDDELRGIHKDATEAAEVGEKSGFDSAKTGKYRDEAHYASMEMHARRNGK